MTPKTFRCPICGHPIACTYKRTDLRFYIEDTGIGRDTNNDLWFPDGFQFHCSNDMGHAFEQTPEFEKWKMNVESIIRNKFDDIIK